MIYVSTKSEPCGQKEGNDINIFRSNVENISKILCEGDIVLADKAFAYNSLYQLASSHGFQMATEVKTSSLEYQGHLTDQYNLDLQMVRSPIERFFGIMKKKFRVLFEKFNFSTLIKEHYNTLFRTCCALYNIHNFNSNEEVEDEYFIYEDDTNNLQDLDSFDQSSTPLSRAIEKQNMFIQRMGIIGNDNPPLNYHTEEEEMEEIEETSEIIPCLESWKIENEEIKLLQDYTKEVESYPNAPISSIKRSLLIIVEILKNSKTQKGISTDLKKINSREQLLLYLKYLIN